MARICRHGDYVSFSDIEGNEGMGGVMSCSVCSGKGQTTVQCGLVMTCPGCRGFGHELPKKREPIRWWKPYVGGTPGRVSFLPKEPATLGEGLVFRGCWVRRSRDSDVKNRMVKDNTLQELWEAFPEPVFAFDLKKTPTNEDGLKVILTGEGE